MNEPQPNSLDRRMRRVESLIESLEKLVNPAARVVAQELVQTLLALHSAGLARMLELLRSVDGGAAIVAAWGRDDLVGNLLLLHGLHPVDLDTRARQALEQVRPMLRCHGADLELVAVAQRLVRVRVQGSCPMSAEALEQALEEAFAATAPDVHVIEVEGGPRRTEGEARRVALPMRAS
jgi:Fe-S cluster biogenesis protein NfuA